jgi:exonuclease SbcC
LGDARDAQVLIPDAQAVINRLANERDKAKSQIAALDVQRQELLHAPQALAVAERRQQRTAQRLNRLTLLNAKQGEMTQARATLQEVEQILATMAFTEGTTPEEQAERSQIENAQQLIQAQRVRQLVSHAQAQRQLQLALEELPPTVDKKCWQQAIDELAQAEKDFKAAEQAHLEAQRAVDRLVLLQSQQQALATRQVACQTQTQRIEKELSHWVLFAKCMGSDGLIALAIDDAGPALSALANNLLKACDGGRFTVSIQTLLENQKKEQKEGFDVVVHDAESGQSQSVTLMSGGEKVLIEACLTRAIALYLAQGSGRSYTTLFSDEADGPLDIDRKRIFMAMKREVLRLGGYEREFYISQTPELTAMADAVIDMDLLRQELDCLPA